MSIFILVLLVLFQNSGRSDGKSISREYVNDLIRSLDASTLSERSGAERQLLELGPEVLSLLPASELIESISVREAIQRIRPQIEIRAARESTASSFVTFHGERTYKEILAELERQTHNRLLFVKNLTDEKSRQIAVNWEKVPFWDCLDDLCLRSDLQYQFVNDEAAIRVIPMDKNGTNLLAIQRTGPFRLSIEKAQVRKIIGDEDQRILRMNGHVFVEPRLRPLFFSMAERDLIAGYGDGKPLSAWNEDAQYEFPVSNGSREVPLQWDFYMPSETDAETVSVRGQFHCLMAAATDRIVFDQKSLARGMIRRRGDTTIWVRKINFEASDQGDLDGEIGITLSYGEGARAFESHRSWVYHNEAYLESQKNDRIHFTECEATPQSDGSVTVRYRWGKLPGPFSQYSFVYESPTLILNVPLNFDLANIPFSR